MYTYHARMASVNVLYELTELLNTPYKKTFMMYIYYVYLSCKTHICTDRVLCSETQQKSCMNDPCKYSTRIAYERMSASTLTH